MDEIALAIKTPFDILMSGYQLHILSKGFFYTISISIVNGKKDNFALYGTIAEKKDSLLIRLSRTLIQRFLFTRQ